MTPQRPEFISVSIPDLAKMIDHNLSHPTITDEEVEKGLEVCKTYDIATAIIKPYHILFAKKILKGSNVGLCPVIGFPHGNSTTEVKIYEAQRALEECKLANEEGIVEAEMVVNIGRVLSGKWEFVENEINLVNKTVVERRGKLKVIFENGYLEPSHIIKLCQICTKIGVAYAKTTTDFNSDYKPPRYNGVEIIPHLDLMRENLGQGIGIAVGSGVTCEEGLLRMFAMGVERVSIIDTKKVLSGAKRRAVGNERRNIMLQ